MQRCRVTVKNFRCFADERPLILDLDLARGYTAFIGPNNAGKSSALRLFYEFRHIWAHLAASEAHIVNHLKSPQHGFGGGVIQDPDEAFSNANKRDMELTFEFLDAPSEYRYVSQFKITFGRRNDWPTITRFQGSDGTVLALGSGQGHGLPAPGLIQPQNQPVYDVSGLLSVMRALRDALYIGAFRNAINQGAGTHYDLQVGTALVQLWNAWKVGGSRANMDKVLEITETIRDMFAYKSLEINASADDKNLFVVVNGKSYLLSELGAGLAQFIIVLANVAIRNPAIILIDEPELNLHPSLQQRFLLQLASYASDGVIFATHSLGLARATAAQIYSFRKTGDIV